MKYDDVYMSGHACVAALTRGLTDCLQFYDRECPHEAMEKRTPDAAYQTAQVAQQKCPRTTRGG